MPGRHGADERDLDRYVPDAGGYPLARHDDTVAYEPGDIVGHEPGRHGSRYRPDGRAHARPDAGDVERSGRRYLDREEPAYPSDEFGSDGYAPHDRDAGGFTPDDEENDDPGDRTAHVPAGAGATGRRRVPDDGDREDPAGEASDGAPPRRRARTGRGAERPTRRRRRWPWVVGGVVAAVALVLVGLTVLGGTQEQPGPTRTGDVVGLGASSGTGQPGTAPTAAPAPPGAAPQAPAAQVTYEVTGSGTAGSITVSRGTTVTQLSDAELPWKQTAPTAAGPAEYSVTASGGSGEMSCKISIAGDVLVEETADGKFGAVSCNGRR